MSDGRSDSVKKLQRKLSKKLGREVTSEELEAYSAKKLKRREKKAVKRKSDPPQPMATSVEESGSDKTAKETKKAKVSTASPASTLADEDTAVLSDFEYDERAVPRDENARTLPKAGDEGIASKRGNLRKKRADGLYPCKEFETQGSCKFGEKCKFSHLVEGEELSEEAKVELQQRQRKRNALCLVFQDTGECAYGDRCRYKHVALTSEQKQAKMEADRLIAESLQGKDSQEDKLKRIMGLPENLRQKARAIFFAKQRGAGFGQGGNKNKNKKKSAEGKIDME